MRALRWLKMMLTRLSDLNPRQLLAIAGVSALCMFGLMYAALTGVEKEVIEPTRSIPTEVPQTAMKTVVVAKTDISEQTLLKREMFETREMPENLVPADAVTDVEAIVNRAAKTKILAGDVMTPQRIYAESEARGFIGMIPKDCRAVAVRVNDITGVAGFARSRGRDPLGEGRKLRDDLNPVAGHIVVEHQRRYGRRRSERRSNGRSVDAGDLKPVDCNVGAKARRSSAVDIGVETGRDIFDVATAQAD